MNSTAKTIVTVHDIQIYMASKHSAFTILIPNRKCQNFLSANGGSGKGP